MSKPREKEKKEKEKEKGRGTAQAHESAHTKEAASEQGGGAEDEARAPVPLAQAPGTLQANTAAFSY